MSELHAASSATGKLQMLLPLGYPQARQPRKQARKLRQEQACLAQERKCVHSMACTPCHFQLRTYSHSKALAANSAQILANKVKYNVGRCLSLVTFFVRNLVERD